MYYKFRIELSDDERTAELWVNLARDNHRSVMASADDVDHGFFFAVSVSVIMVLPCGLADKFTLTDTGVIIQKSRLTQDLSFSVTAEDVAINKRVTTSNYPEMIMKR